METLGARDDNVDQVEAHENDNIVAAFELCEAIDEVRLNRLDDIEWDKEIGNEYLILRWAEEDNGDCLQACVEWYDDASGSVNATSPVQPIRSVLLEDVRGGEVASRVRYWFLSNGEATRLDEEDTDSEEVPATYEEITGLRVLLAGEAEETSLGQAA